MIPYGFSKHLSSLVLCISPSSLFFYIDIPAFSQIEAPFSNFRQSPSWNLELTDSTTGWPVSSRSLLIFASLAMKL